MLVCRSRSVVRQLLLPEITCAPAGDMELAGEQPEFLGGISESKSEILESCSGELMFLAGEMDSPPWKFEFLNDIFVSFSREAESLSKEMECPSGEAEFLSGEAAWTKVLGSRDLGLSCSPSCNYTKDAILYPE